MSDPAKFLQYVGALGAELSLLAEHGHKQFATGQGVNGSAAFIVAVGEEETAMLNRVIERLEQDAEFVAWRQSREQKAATEVVAAFAPDRN